MQDDIKEWLEKYGARVEFAEPVRIIDTLLTREAALQADGISLTAKNWQMAWERAYAQVQHLQSINRELAAPNQHWVDKALAAEAEAQTLREKLAFATACVQRQEANGMTRRRERDEARAERDALREKVRELTGETK